MLQTSDHRPLLRWGPPSPRWVPKGQTPSRRSPGGNGSPMMASQGGRQSRFCPLVIPSRKIHRPCQIGIGRLVPFLVPFWNCQLFRVYLPEAKCCGWLNRENQWRSSQASSWCQRFHWLVSMLSAGSTKNQISNLLDDLFFKCRKWHIIEKWTDKQWSWSCKQWRLNCLAHRL